MLEYQVSYMSNRYLDSNKLATLLIILDLFFRASEPLLSVFMWGINHTVRELAHISQPVMLMPDDFRAFTKIKVDNFAFNKENLPSHFKVSPLISTALW